MKEFPAIQTQFVALAVEDLGRSLMFYQHLLRQEPAVYQADRHGEFHGENLRLVLFVPEKYQAPHFLKTGPGPMSLCLTVPGPTELAQASECLTAWGYPPCGPIFFTSHGQELHCLDPDGNRIILYAPHAPVLESMDFPSGAEESGETL